MSACRAIGFQKGVQASGPSHGTGRVGRWWALTTDYSPGARPALLLILGVKWSQSSRRPDDEAGSGFQALWPFTENVCRPCSNSVGRDRGTSKAPQARVPPPVLQNPPSPDSSGWSPSFGKWRRRVLQPGPPAAGGGDGVWTGCSGVDWAVLQEFPASQGSRCPVGASLVRLRGCGVGRDLSPERP